MYLLLQSPGPEAVVSNQASSDRHVEKDKDKDNTEGAMLGSGAESGPEATKEAPDSQAVLEEQEQEVVAVRQRQTENKVSEVEIPNVGRIMVRADADGYNEEVRTCQNVI